MSANKSNLSDPHYGYDIVVATTQASINATMKKFLLGLEGQDVYILVVNKPGTDGAETMLISWDDLRAKTNDADPFSIPNGVTSKTDATVAALDRADFVAGIKITLGLPKNYDKLSDLPDIINLREGATMVEYRMLCADIKIVELTYSKYRSKWTAMSQNEQRNRAWTTVSKVNMRMDKDSKEWNQLLKAAQGQHKKNLTGSMFDVSQLLLDLNNATLSTLPTLSGLDEGSKARFILGQYFCGKYFAALQAKGQPILSYTVSPKTQDATFAPKDLNFHVSPLVKETDENLKTLDYLCATGKDPVPPATNFTWDWVNAEDARQEHGVIAINRNTFATYLRDILVDQAKTQCFWPRARNWRDGAKLWFECHPDYSGPTEVITTQPKPDANTRGKLVALTSDANNDGKLVTISYYDKAEDEAGAGGGLGAIALEVWYDATAKANDNKITVDSSFKVHLYIRGLQNKNAADIVKKTYQDVIKLVVDDHGKMKTTKTTPVEKDEGGTDSVNGFSNFFADVNSVFNGLKSINYVGNNFKGTEIKALDGFIFPGGKTFAFKNFHFSEKQDLLCGITYADPS